MPPAILEDPASPHAAPPKPTAEAARALQPRTVVLKDHVTVATIIPIPSTQPVPAGLLSHLHNEFNNEIERGDTYPMDAPMTLEGYRNYWFGTFAVIMLLGNDPTLREDRDWVNEVLGTFYIKPNYPGRCNHICNAGFLACHIARNKGVGRLLGEAYLEYAPKLGYTYSVFNLVFETNIASIRIWESLGFKRIGVVKGAGRLKGYEEPVNAVIFGRDLGDDENYVSDERFDKIRFYLEKGKYPPSADRSEKSRLRSAATHYRLEGNKLMLKDKKVITNGHQQYEIAKRIHGQNHGGINKTTALISDKYHWVRIKETVSAVIKNCAECKENTRAPVVKGTDRTSNSPGVMSHPTPESTAAIMQQYDLNNISDQKFDLNGLPSQMAGLEGIDLPVDPNMIESVLDHQDNHHHHLAPVAQMHVAPLDVVQNPSPEDIIMDDRHSASAEIARAALTEEDRAMRDQLVEGLSRINDSTISAIEEAMDLDSQQLHYEHKTFETKPADEHKSPTKE